MAVESCFGDPVCTQSSEDECLAGLFPSPQKGQVHNVVAKYP